MLIEILKKIATSESNSYTSLAKTLNLDQEMVKQMFYNLQRMGYIISDDPACGDGKCDECGVCPLKRKNESKENKISSGITRWKLTEKGKEAVERK
jgi:predicted transcriptional regulator